MADRPTRQERVEDLFWDVAKNVATAAVLYLAAVAAKLIPGVPWAVWTALGSLTLIVLLFVVDRVKTRRGFAAVALVAWGACTLVFFAGRKMTAGSKTLIWMNRPLVAGHPLVDAVVSAALSLLIFVIAAFLVTGLALYAFERRLASERAEPPSRT